jgi:hypothetical protein
LLSWDCTGHRDPRLCSFSTRARPTFWVLGPLPSKTRQFYTAKSPGSEKWALLAWKKSTDVGLGVLYNPSLGSVLIRVLNRQRVLVRRRRPRATSDQHGTDTEFFQDGEIACLCTENFGILIAIGDSPNRTTPIKALKRAELYAASLVVLGFQCPNPASMTYPIVDQLYYYVPTLKRGT